MSGDTWDDEKHPEVAVPTTTAEPAPENPPGAGRPASNVIATGNEEDAPKGLTQDWPQYKVEPPLGSFTWQGIVVTDEFAPVDPEKVGPLVSAARAVGVELTLKEA